MEEVTEICDRTIFLKQGKIIADDLPSNLAKSVSAFRIKLVIADGLKRTIAIAEQAGFKYKVEHRTIEIATEEGNIPPFLDALSKASVAYASIRIEEPSLEDFFFQIAKGDA
jgi:ABC-2 type transport system ATP-binding protein